jgi:hypothetical protein
MVYHRSSQLNIFYILIEKTLYSPYLGYTPAIKDSNRISTIYICTICSGNSMITGFSNFEKKTGCSRIANETFSTSNCGSSDFWARIFMRDCPRGNEAWAHHCLLQCQALGECAPSSEGGESGHWEMHQFWDEIFLNKHTQKWRVHQFWSWCWPGKLLNTMLMLLKGHLSLWYPYLDEAINFRNRQMSLLVGHFDRRLPTWSTACVDFRCSISDTLCRVDRKSAKLWCAPMGKVSSKLGDGLQLTQKVTNKQPTIGSGVFPHPTRVYHGIPNNFVEPYLGCTWAPGINLNASRKSTSFG